MKKRTPSCTSPVDTTCRQRDALGRNSMGPIEARSSLKRANSTRAENPRIKMKLLFHLRWTLDPGTEQPHFNFCITGRCQTDPFSTPNSANRYFPKPSYVATRAADSITLPVLVGLINHFYKDPGLGSHSKKKGGRVKWLTRALQNSLMASSVQPRA